MGKDNLLEPMQEDDSENDSQQDDEESSPDGSSVPAVAVVLSLQGMNNQSPAYNLPITLFLIDTIK